MSIENRLLEPGTKLVGMHRKATYLCEVVTTAEGEIRYQLTDGRQFKSPSSAARAVMNGVSANGWRFWSIASEESASSDHALPPAPTSPRAGANKIRLQIKKVANQKGVEEGKARWFCSGCMKSFLLPTGQEPAACPEGHSWHLPDEG